MIFLALILSAFIGIGSVKVHGLNPEIKEELTDAYNNYINGVSNLSRRDEHDRIERTDLSIQLLKTFRELQKEYDSIAGKFLRMFYKKDLKLFIGRDKFRDCRVNFSINEFGLIECEIYHNFRCVYSFEM